MNNEIMQFFIGFPLMLLFLVDIILANRWRHEASKYAKEALEHLERSKKLEEECIAKLKEFENTKYDAN